MGEDVVHVPIGHLVLAGIVIGVALAPVIGSWLEASGKAARLQEEAGRYHESAEVLHLLVTAVPAETLDAYRASRPDAVAYHEFLATVRTHVPLLPLSLSLIACADKLSARWPGLTLFVTPGTKEQS